MKLKRCIALILASVMIALFVSACGGSDENTQGGGSADNPAIDDNTYIATADDLEYSYRSDGTLTINGYKGSESVIAIPSSIDGAEVTYVGSEAFLDCEILESVVLPDTLTDISDKAFCGCINLEKVYFPDSLTSVQEGAFFDTKWYNDQPDGVVYMGSVAYGYKGDRSACPSEIVIRDGIKTIRSNAFSGCSGLESVVIPDSVINIGSRAFDSCTNLSSVTYSGSPDELGYDVFANTAWYDDLPDGVVYIGKAALEYKGDGSACPPEIAIADGTTSIRLSAFWECTGLQSVTIPDTVTYIDDNAFYGCVNLAEITASDSVIEAGYDLFRDTKWYDSQPDGVIYIGRVACMYKGDRENCPEEIVLREDTTWLSEYLFKECTGLKRISMPDTVAGIAHEAFDGCTSLESLTIPSSVTCIESQSFTNCDSLTSLTIPGSVKKIGFEAFWGCENLSSVTLSDSLVGIESGAFYGCGLRNVNIPASVVYFEENTFSHCAQLESITVDLGNPVFDSRNNCNAIIRTKSNDLVCGCVNTVIPDTVTEISSMAFSGHRKIADIRIPDSVVTVGRTAYYDTKWYDNQPDGVVYVGNVLYGYKGKGSDCPSRITVKEGTVSITNLAFDGCTGLHEIELPDSLQKIGGGAFWGSGLESIRIPASVTVINSHLCGSSLESITVDEGNPVYDSRNDCNAIIETASNTLICGSKSAVIPNGIKRIGNKAFDGTGLSGAVSIPDSVVLIDEYAFRDCPISSVTIPESVKLIMSSAFSGCDELESVNYSGAREDWNSVEIGYSSGLKDKAVNCLK